MNQKIWYVVYVKKAWNYILHFIHLRIFITLISFPILVWWGLPLSLLSPIGNLIFSPVLTLFLILSFLLFFSEALHIPNGWIAQLLDMLTIQWTRVMHIDSTPWLVSFAKPSLFVLLCIPVSAFCIIHYKYFKRYQSIIALFLILLCTCLYLKITHTKKNGMETIPCNRGSITLMHTGKQTALIDPGVIGQRLSAPSWIEYTLVPHLIKTGVASLDYVIALQPSSLLFQALATLVNKMAVKTLYLTCWQGLLNKQEWRHYFALQQVCREHSVVCKRIATQPITLKLDEQATILIGPLEKTITQKTITYPALTAKLTLHDTMITLHSYKFKMTTDCPRF